MLSFWESVNQRQEKIERGFYIAKLLAKRSKEEAEQMISRCSELRHQGPLTSSSCIDAFYESHGLYVDSLVTLIIRGLCDESTLQAFKDDEDNLVCESEQSSMWGRIALAYHLAGNEDMFRSVGDQYLPTDYSHFTPEEQKWLIYNTTKRTVRSFISILHHFLASTLIKKISFIEALR